MNYKKYRRKNKTSIRHKQKIKGLRALYLYYCYLLKVFPKQKYPPKYSKAMKEEIKKWMNFQILHNDQSSAYMQSFGLVISHLLFSEELPLLWLFRQLYKIGKRHRSFSTFDRVNLRQEVNHIAKIPMVIIETSILLSSL